MAPSPRDYARKTLRGCHSLPSSTASRIAMSSPPPSTALAIPDEGEAVGMGWPKRIASPPSGGTTTPVNSGSASGGAQPGEVRPRPQLSPQVVRQRSDVGPGRALDPQGEIGRLIGTQLEPGDIHGARSQLGIVAGPRDLVGLAPLDFDGAEGGRLLLEQPPEPWKALLDFAPRRSPSGLAGDFAGAVAGARGNPEAHRRLVFLGRGREILAQPGGGAETQDKHAGGARVEGPGVADLADAGPFAAGGPPLVRCRGDGFVDGDEGEILHAVS